MQVFILTSRIGQLSSKKWTVADQYDTECYRTLHEAYKNLAYSHMSYLEDSFVEIYREIKCLNEHRIIGREHIVRIVMKKKKTDLMAALEINRYEIW